MCTLVILRRPGDDWPLLLAVNRDERFDRPWLAPGRHWDDRPDVTAGLDQAGGGAWLGVNDYGLVAAVMNREGTLGPAEGKRSRGELVLEALDHAEAGEAARALADLDPSAYRGFNLFVADSREAWCLHGRKGAAAVQVLEVPRGFSMLTSGDLNDRSQPRIRLHLPRFEAAAVPDPETGDWEAWQALLATRVCDAALGPRAAMTLDNGEGFGTVSSSLLALPLYPGQADKPVWLFAPGPAGRAVFEPVRLEVEPSG